MTISRWKQPHCGSFSIPIVQLSKKVAKLEIKSFVNTGGLLREKQVPVMMDHVMRLVQQYFFYWTFIQLNFSDYQSYTWAQIIPTFLTIQMATEEVIKDFTGYGEILTLQYNLQIYKTRIL